MKTILTTLNSKYIHSNLAIRYLSTYVEDKFETHILEFTINQNIDYISREIFKLKADIIGFSTYIWNLNETLEISKILKIVNPNLKIILGGPEVSFDGVKLMKENSHIDFIVYGEGEETFKELLGAIHEDEGFYNIKGLIFRDNKDIVKNREREFMQNLDTIPSPYEKDAKGFENKIVYYESSRGCPFNCEFCLSSTLKGVRYFDLERVKRDLDILIDNKVRQIKFVDRTFNANKEYAMEIMRFVMDKDPKDINVHFEVTAHLIDEEMLEFLKTAKEGLFQFEIGVQSTNPNTIEAIGRTTDFHKLKKVTNTISSYNNIHQHLDLIAGLPYEDYNSFKNSFNDVYDLRPEKLQLGFLKLLKGSGLRLNEEKYGYKYLDKPPYEVLENKYIPFTDIIALKEIEDLVEKYYNEGNFKHSLEYIIKNHQNNAFEFYEEFAKYWRDKRYHEVSHSKKNLYVILKDYIESKNYKDGDIIKDILKYDYVSNNRRSQLPLGLQGDYKEIEQKRVHRVLKDSTILEKYLFEYIDTPTKKIINQVSINKFKYDILHIIDKNYNSDIKEREMYILFKYRDGEILNCNTYDITEKLKELY